MTGTVLDVQRPFPRIRQLTEMRVMETTSRKKPRRLPTDNRPRSSSTSRSLCNVKSSVTVVTCRTSMGSLDGVSPRMGVHEYCCSDLPTREITTGLARSECGPPTEPASVLGPPTFATHAPTGSGHPSRRRRFVPRAVSTRSR